MSEENAKGVGGYLLQLGSRVGEDQGGFLEEVTLEPNIRQ